MIRANTELVSKNKLPTILIVDDNPINIEILFNYLTENKYRVLVARDGETAIQRAVFSRPDLILLDILMPRVDGFETCRRLKENPQTMDIPVIFITGLSDPFNLIKGFEAGAVDYLVKPLQLAEVQARINTHLKLRSLVIDLETINSDLHQRNLYLETSRLLGQVTADFLDLNTMLSNSVSLIMDHLKYGFTGVWLMDDENQELSLSAYAGENSFFDSKVPLHSPENLLAQTFLTNTPHQDQFTAVKKGEVNQLIGIPLSLGKKSVGVLLADLNRKGSASVEELNLLETLGNQIVVAVRNAQLFSQEQLRIQEIERINHQLEAYTYSVSHDLRAPVRILDGYCQILKEDYMDSLPEDGKNVLLHIETNIERMGELINDLLKFSRTEKQMINKHLLQPDLLIQEVLSGFSQEISGRNIDISIEHLPECKADSSLLKQVWTNLLSNAIKYTQQRDHAEIKIGCIQNVEYPTPVYFIRDNGAGFDMKYAAKLFGVFQRLHSSQEFEGTGVGLAIVQNIIQRHGGKIWAESEINQGATFYFTLG
jgi:signal transduction histidine kinase/CheY-like chemotaxis protein